jgi:hypothetical protein
MPVFFEWEKYYAFNRKLVEGYHTMREYVAWVLATSCAETVSRRVDAQLAGFSPSFIVLYTTTPRRRACSSTWNTSLLYTYHAFTASRVVCIYFCQVSRWGSVARRHVWSQDVLNTESFDHQSERGRGGRSRRALYKTYGSRDSRYTASATVRFL